MQMSIVRNYRLFKVQRLCQKKEFVKARALAQKLLKETPESVVSNTVLADVFLFSGKLREALAQYKVAKAILDAKYFDAKNKRFLAAYINIRSRAINYRIAGKSFQNAMEFAKLINGLEAQKNLKSLFSLPE